MKVHILRVPSHLQPKSQPFKYPKHNADYGVEQDFHQFLMSHPQLTVEHPQDADWHYLPVYWTRWHLLHDYGKSGKAELQKAVDQIIVDGARTFTICQYDDGPLIDVKGVVQFLASRKAEEGIDIPLLAASHKRPFFVPRKTYQASFIGRLSTHVIRKDMACVLTDHPDIFIFDGVRSARFFVRKTLASWIALAPRGYGGSSFRFFEAMQLGVVPLLVGDLDTRPFKKFIDWEACSLYVSNPADIPQTLEKHSREQLETMGRSALDVYGSTLAFGHWCNLVLRELTDRMSSESRCVDVL